MPRKIVRDRDLGWRRLGKALRDTSATAVEVGVQPGSQRQEGGPTNAEVAAWHEYGTVFAPKRSFLRSTFDRKWPEYRALGSALARRVLLGGMPKRAALAALGLKFAGDVKATIRAGIPPALAQSTIDAKGSSTPLIDSGQLIGSITAKVIK